MPSSARVQVIRNPVSLTVRGAPPRGTQADAFARTAAEATGAPLRAASIGTFQVNVGLRCNLACRHCHVESGPKRTEEMTWETMVSVLRAASLAGAETIDITGGAPEMNRNFRPFVAFARARGHKTIVRTNLTIMLEDGYGGLPEFYRRHRVHLVASLPCYLEVNVDKQRGRRVFTESIDVIRRLNAVGYGIASDLPLDLVYNPGGPTLPPPQDALETEYRRELDRLFGLRFTRLYTITNMPIGRFQRDLERSGRAEDYGRMLRSAFNPAAIEPLMCRHQVHVGHDGALYDCDFNYALRMGACSCEPASDRLPRHIRELNSPEAIEAFRTRPIATGKHCFACTAGCGSSCGGAIA